MIISKKEFAELLGLHQKHLPTYYDRGKIVYDTSQGKPMVDTCNPVNTSTIVQRCLALNKPIPMGMLPKGYEAPEPKQVLEKPTKEPKTVKKAPPKIEAPKVVPAKAPVMAMPQMSMPLPQIGLPKPMGLPTNTPQKSQIDIKNKINSDLFDIESNKKKLETAKLEQDLRLARNKADKAEGEVIPIAPIKALFLQYSKSITMEFRQVIEKHVTLLEIQYKLTPQKVAEMRREMTDSLNKAVVLANEATKKSVANIISDYAPAKDESE